jgi:hypothetical protein
MPLFQLQRAIALAVPSKAYVSIGRKLTPHAPGFDPPLSTSFRLLPWARCHQERTGATLILARQTSAEMAAKSLAQGIHDFESAARLDLCRSRPVV